MAVMIDALWTQIDKIIAKRIAETSPFEATVTDVHANGTVRISRISDNGSRMEYYARLDSGTLAVNDVVYCSLMGGKPFIHGRIVRGSRPAGSVPSTTLPVFRVSNATPDTQYNTTSTGTATTAHTFSFNLPSGTWTLRALGSINLISSASQAAVVTFTVDGTATTATTRPIASGAYDRIEVTQTKTGVTGGGSKTLAIGFHNSTAGTMYAADASILVWGERTA
jgi:hypothetical protein